MTEKTEADQTQNTQSSAVMPGGDASVSPRGGLPDMRGRVNHHTSGYWALTIPALSVRYLAESAAGVIGTNRKKLAESFKSPWLQKIAQMSERDAEKALDKVEAPIVGTFMMAVSSLYLNRTYQDIKHAFAEPVAWEMNKKPEDVGLLDLIRSKNTLVEAARHNFVKYNSRRYAVNTPFFSYLLPGKKVEPKHAILGGVSANSLYLMSDVLWRKETFFERMQSFVDDKILHTDQLGDKIAAVDLVNLYELHARDKNPSYRFDGRMDTQGWNNQMQIFGRVAELMNQTYGNEPNKEKANFTLSKMIYLMGHGLISAENVDRSMAYVELANKNGMDAVKEVASHDKGSGEDVAFAREKYHLAPASVPATVNAKEDGTSQKDEKPQQGFAARFAPTDAGMSNSEKVMARQATANEGGYVRTA